MKKFDYLGNRTFSTFRYFYEVCFLLFLFSFLFPISCATYRLEKNLDFESKEFLSKVRYIITKEERKNFLNLPPSERKRFVEGFWEKRDDDPETEENEYKEEYFKRIEEANHLFTDGGPPGWLQDRGRIYILFGPPWQREVYPRGSHFYGKPMEIWHYGFFPIVFIDNYWNGNYKLEPLNAWYISEINRAQMDLKPKILSEEVTFEFDLKIKKVKENEVAVQVIVPYKNIWFTEKKGKLEAILSLTFDIFDSSEKKVWEHQKNYPISLTEIKLEEIVNKDYSIEIRVKLVKGNYILIGELKNETDGNRAWKRVEFTI